MFQSRNYGNDFIGAMSATAGMLNDRRKMEMAEKEQADKEKRYAAEAETRTLTNEGLRQDNALKVAKLDREKALKEILPHFDNVINDKMEPKDKARFAGVTEELLKEIPYTPDTFSGFTPEYMSNINNLARGVSELSSLPAGNYKYTVEDNVPEINKTLQGFNSLLSKDRLGKTFTDADGSITGKPGAKYKTLATHGFMMMSGEGNQAGFVPLFSVADENGKPIVGADGRAVTVPSTEDGSNGPNAKLRIVKPEELMVKLGFVNKLAAVAQKLNTPEARKEYVRGQLPAYMEPEDGAKALAESLKPKEKKLINVDPTHNVYDETGKLVVAGTPKEKEDKAPTRNEYEKDGYKITEEYIGDGKWKVVGRNKIRVPREPADPSVAENKRQETQSKAEIDKAIDAVNAAKKRLADAKKADPESQDTKDAAQELADAKTAYLNRTKEHKQSFGRDYNPIKEVIERRPARDITPLADGFASEGGVFSGRDYPTYIAQAERKGWTKAEIIQAAKGTNGESAVNEYYAAKPQAAKGMKQGTAPSPKKTQVAKADTRPPLSAFMKRKP